MARLMRCPECCPLPTKDLHSSHAKAGSAIAVGQRGELLGQAGVHDPNTALSGNHRRHLPGGTTGLHDSVVGGQLLDRPAVAVGVAEENEVSPIEMLDVAHLDSPAR